MPRSHRNRRRRFAGNHQQSWLYGRHAVAAMLAGSRWRPREFYVDADLPSGTFALDAADDLRIHRIDAERLAELCGSREHQGAAARMPPYPYLTVEELVASAPRRLLVCDRVQYANNFGTMLRSAEVFGFDACLVPERGQCELTAAIGRMSAGAAFHVPVAQTDDLAAAVAALAAAGIRVFGTDPASGVDCDAADLSEPVAIVIGAEHDGIAPEVAAACGQTLRIPQHGQTQSLNASSSAAVLMYEVARQSRA